MCVVFFCSGRSEDVKVFPVEASLQCDRQFRVKHSCPADHLAFCESCSGLVCRSIWLYRECQLLQKMDGSPITFLEWVAQPPRKGNRNALYERLDRVDLLKTLKVDQYPLEGVPEANLTIVAGPVLDMALLLDADQGGSPRDAYRWAVVNR